MTKLKPCPCGETPTAIYLNGKEGKWAWVSGNCCTAWNIEFRTNYAAYKGDMKQLYRLALEAWNSAPRAWSGYSQHSF